MATIGQKLQELYIQEENSLKIYEATRQAAEKASETDISNTLNNIIAEKEAQLAELEKILLMLNQFGSTSAKRLKELLGLEYKEEPEEEIDISKTDDEEETNEEDEGYLMIGGDPGMGVQPLTNEDIVYTDEDINAYLDTLDASDNDKKIFAPYFKKVINQYNFKSLKDAHKYIIDNFKVEDGTLASLGSPPVGVAGKKSKSVVSVVSDNKLSPYDKLVNQLKKQKSETSVSIEQLVSNFLEAQHYKEDEIRNMLPLFMEYLKDVKNQYGWEPKNHNDLIRPLRDILDTYVIPDEE